MAFSIILVIIGIVFVVVGALIFFKNINFLAVGNDINKSNDKYARRIGLEQFVCGIVMVLCGAASFFLNILITTVLFIVIVFLVLLILGVTILRRKK